MRIVSILHLYITILIVSALPGISSAQSDNSQTTFYFAVSAMASPAPTLVHFTEFQNYLAGKLETSVSLKQRRTYAEINDLLAREKVKMAFTCTGGYLSGRKAFGLELLAVPVMNGKTSYRSYIITRQENPASSLTDLKDSIFAFTDPLSLTGYIYPTARINQMGLVTTDFFRKIFYTESHDKSIEAVATGVAEGAAVDSLIFDALRKQSVSFTDRLKIIEISEEFGMPPVVVPPGLSVQLKRKLLKVLLSMDEDPEGLKVLHSLGMDGFVLPEPDGKEAVCLGETNTILSQKHAEKGPVAASIFLHYAYKNAPEDAKEVLRSYFYTIKVNGLCNLCPGCQGMCPTGALKRIADGEGEKRLMFTSSACSGCGLCVDFCKRNAIEVGRGISGDPDEPLRIC